MASRRKGIMMGSKREGITGQSLGITNGGAGSGGGIQAEQQRGDGGSAI
jgi:hypothetical protein